MSYELLSSAIEQEALYSALFDALPGNALLLKADAPRFTIVAATPKLLQLAGVKKDKVLGRGIFEAFHSNPLEPGDTGENNLRASLLHVVEHKVPHQLPVQRYDVAGEGGFFAERYWSVENSPVPAPNGEVAYIVHTTEDITDGVKAGELKEQMKGMEQAYNLFMQAPLPICILKGPGLVVELANEPTLELWGKTKEVIGLPLEEAVPELKGQGYAELVNEVRESGQSNQVYESPVTLVRNGKKEVAYVNYIYEPYYEEGQSRAVGVLAIGNDVTDKVLAKKEVKESEAKYRSLFQSMDQGFCVLEMIYDGSHQPIDYRFLETNPVFEQQTGLKDAAGKRAKDLVPNLESHWLELYGKVALTGEAMRFTEGSEAMGRWFDVYAFAMGEAQSNRVALLFTDITERRKAEEALKQSESNLRNMILQAPVAMAILRGPSFVVEIANERMYELWGRGKEEILNKSIFAGLPEVRNQGYEELLTGVYTTGKTFSALGIPVTLPRSEGIKTVYINLLYEAFREGDGSISGIMAVATDVTEQVLATQKIEEVVAQRTKELERANKELRRSNQNLEDFAYAASHDLKEPVRKVHFFSDRLKGELAGKLTEAQQRLFERIEHSNRRMGLLIDDLLTYSQFSRGIATPETVDLNEKVRQVLEDLELSIQEKGAKIAVDPLPIIQGQQRQWQQLFQNLLGNALKYSQKGTAPVIQVHYRTIKGAEAPVMLSEEEHEKSFHLIEVRDNGIGFEQKEAERIFQMFQRLHGKAEYEGTGIGLSIVQKVVENHRGYIWAEAQPGAGATFNVLLPTE